MEQKVNIPAEEAKENIKRIFDSKDKVTKINENKDEKIIPINEINKKWDMNDRIVDLFIKNIVTDQNLRQKYAVILIIILSIELIALILIFILKGLNILNYSDSTFNLFITGGIAEVFVLVRVIVKYLFKDNLTKALNIILENNNPIKRYTNNYNKNKIKNKEN
mgnify:FL=1